MCYYLDATDSHFSSSLIRIEKGKTHCASISDCRWRSVLTLGRVAPIFHSHAYSTAGFAKLAIVEKQKEIVTDMVIYIFQRASGKLAQKKSYVALNVRKDFSVGHPIKSNTPTS